MRVFLFFCRGSSLCITSSANTGNTHGIKKKKQLPKTQVYNEESSNKDFLTSYSKQINLLKNQSYSIIVSAEIKVAFFLALVKNDWLFCIFSFYHQNLKMAFDIFIEVSIRKKFFITVVSHHRIDMLRTYMNVCWYIFLNVCRYMHIHVFI